MLFGAHVSSAGGLENSLIRARKLQIKAMQTFATSPRMIKFNQVSPESIAKYNELKPDSGVKVHLFHGNYLINLASEKPEYVKKCAETLIAHQRLANQIEGLGTIFHIGSHKGAGLEAVLKQVGAAIKTVLTESPKGVKLILENTAGQNGPIGATFEELARVINEVESLGGETTDLGIGIDTQHAFGSGYDLANEEGVEKLVKDCSHYVGLARVKVIHVNDSLVNFNSKRDRHANLGEGLIGLAGLKLIINRPELRHLPFILEVPGKDKSGPRLEDVKILESLGELT